MYMSGNRVASGSTLVLFCLLAGCGQPEIEPCADRGDEFFTESINRYLSAHGRSADVNRFTYAGAARYDEYTNWWMVPFDLGEQRYLTMLSCDGKLELSGRP
ncbi:hypothetical protein ACTACG_03285 [Pseudomonas syringae]|uniref:hypothetical protein n=1 Tax=Pseudomonas syringae TaxID=317 RepID=UPI003F74C469